MLNKFEELKQALMLINLKGDIRQPHNYVMGRVASGFSRWNIASIYFNDIQRIIKELNMSYAFISKLPNEDYFTTNSITPEDYVMYHQGYFLDLIHQLKDKLCQFIRAIVNPDPNFKDVQISLNKLYKTGFIQNIPQLLDYIKEWDDNGVNNGTIVQVLKKRTHYHHLKNPLTNAEHYVKSKTLRSLLDPIYQGQLSAYGKEMVAERGRKSFEIWHNDTIVKMENTLKAINSNVENISNELLNFLKIPKQNDTKAKKIFLKFLRLLELEELQDPPWSKNTIPELFVEILDFIRDNLKEAFGNSFLSMYVLGSTIRNEFIYNLSDINVLIVLSEEQSFDVKSLVERTPRAIGIPLEINVLSKSKFLLPQNEKLRFFCKNDGVLYYGENLLNTEGKKKISFDLVWFLNSDFKDKLLEYKKRVTENAVLESDYPKIARDLSKRAYKLGFGQVTGNHLKFSTSIKEMRRLINFYYPQNRLVSEKLYQMLTYQLIIDREGLISVIEMLERNFIPLYDKILAVANKNSVGYSLMNDK